MVLVPPPGHWVFVSVLPAVWGQDKVAPVLDSLSLVEEGSEPDRVLVWSSHGVTTLSELSGTVLSGDGEVSSLIRSDGSGSSVEDPPLVPFPWGVVPDSELMLAIAGSS